MDKNKEGILLIRNEQNKRDLEALYVMGKNIEWKGSIACPFYRILTLEFCLEDLYIKGISSRASHFILLSAQGNMTS